jgi:hypothetical protein
METIIRQRNATMTTPSNIQAQDFFGSASPLPSSRVQVSMLYPPPVAPLHLRAKQLHPIEVDPKSSLLFPVLPFTDPKRTHQEMKVSLNPRQSSIVAICMVLDFDSAVEDMFLCDQQQHDSSSITPSAILDNDTFSNSDDDSTMGSEDDMGMPNFPEMVESSADAATYLPCTDSPSTNSSEAESPIQLLPRLQAIPEELEDCRMLGFFDI